MKRALKIYLEKPELVGVVLLVALTAFFEIRSHGVFFSLQNIRGVLGLLPEVGAVTIGFAMLMICGEFDLSVGSVFAIMPMSIALMLNAGVPFWPASADPSAGPEIARGSACRPAHCPWLGQQFRA